MENDKINNEARIKELEVKLKETDLELKEIELELKKRERDSVLGSKLVRFIKRYSFLSTVGAAILGLVVTGIGYFIQSSLNRQVEREKFQGQLILKAIETGNPEAATKNLLFLVKTGLITDQTGMIASLKPEDAPVLPISNESMLPFDTYRTPASPRKITEIILLETYASDRSATIDIMKKTKGSFHYLIDKDGTVHRLVNESAIAIHSKGHNDNSIAIGLVHQPGTEEYPEIQLQNLVTLLVEVSNRYSVDVENILTINELSGTIPGTRSSDIEKIIGRIRDEVKRKKDNH